MLKWTLLLGAVSAAVLAFSLYQPLPDGMKEPWKVQTIMMVIGLSNRIAKVLTYMGRGKFHENLRATLEVPLSRNLSSAKLGDMDVSRDVLAGVPVVIYRPKSLAKEDKAPTVIFFHGGGFVVGCADTYDLTAHSIAKGTQSMVISVDYRRAPEHPFPAAPQDCLAVTRHVLRNGEKMGVDVNKVGVAGDSAGGNLAAVVALQLSKEQKELPPLKFQVLYYPLLQAVDLMLPAYLDNDKATPNLLTRDFIGYFIALYFGLENEDPVSLSKIIASNRHIPDDIREKSILPYVNAGLLPENFQKPKTQVPAVTSQVNTTLYKKIADFLVDPLFCPFFADDVSDVAPAFVHAAEFDVLRDDALMYTNKLFKAGVRVQGYLSEGGYHSEISSTGRDYMKPETGRVALEKSFEFMKSEFDMSD